MRLPLLGMMITPPATDMGLAYNPIMPDRRKLYELIDSLPDGRPKRGAGRAGAVANMAATRTSASEGNKGGSWSECGGASGPVRAAAAVVVAAASMGPDGGIEYGGYSHSHWDGDTVVIETHRFHAGHELVIEERLRSAHDGARLVYEHSVSGPGGTADTREVAFDVREE